MEACFQGNQPLWAIKHSIIDSYSKYLSLLVYMSFYYKFPCITHLNDTYYMCLLKLGAPFQHLMQSHRLYLPKADSSASYLPAAKLGTNLSFFFQHPVPALVFHLPSDHRIRLRVFLLGSAPEGVDDLSFHTYGEFSPASSLSLPPPLKFQSRSNF